MSLGATRNSNTGAVTGLTRRGVLFGLPLALAACQTTAMGEGGGTTNPTSIYGTVNADPFVVPPVNLSEIDPVYYRRTVPVPSHIPNKPSEIVVDPFNRFLYLILLDRTAIRYGVGVGRAGFAWSGRASIQRKAEWPSWTPTVAMMQRDPAARPWAASMPGGPTNPLGARALYLDRGGADTLYRIHGTPEAWSIGQAVSSGCIRTLNQGALHLYDLVPMGTQVTVLSA